MTSNRPFSGRNRQGLRDTGSRWSFRHFAVFALALPIMMAFAADAQTPARTYRIGYIQTAVIR